MFSSKLVRIGLPLFLLAAGLWFITRPVTPASESVTRQQALQALAPSAAVSSSTGIEPLTEVAIPVTVNMADIPAGVYDPNNQLDRWKRGEIDLEEEIGIRSPEELAALKEAALSLEPDADIQLVQGGPGLNAPVAGAAFDSIDINECCGGGANVPPDPELAVGPNHVIAVVNVVFEIYDKNGNSLQAPTTFASFMSANPNCTGVFDPNVLYDEEWDRFVLGIDADGSGYCLAVSQTGNPLGSWNLYFFATGSNFFDYPHAGVGRDAIYMGANIFQCTFFGCTFLEGRVWAFDKTAMYNGQAAAAVTRGLGSNEDTAQPLNLHGWNQGTWPTSGPHYFISETGYNGADHTVFSWNDPFGANTWTTVGVVDLNAATGVTAGAPLDVPQSGGSDVQANDFRPLDFEYRNGYGWTTMTIACNPGGGTVDCVRWAQIDPATATVVQAGVYSSSGDYRFFPDLAVDHCDDMTIGYSKSSTSMWPSVWYTGRESGDALNTLQAESQLKAGELVYTAFDSVPRRWGDYTGMTIDPDGMTFWYLGEYSKNTGNPNGRWGTYIGSFSYGSCSVGPTPTPTSTSVAPTPTNTPVPPTPTNTPQPGNTFTFNPVADAYVISSRPDGNRGGSSQLRTDAAPDTLSYLRFDVQGLSGTITNATLRLYVQRNSSIGYDVQSVSDNSWGELTITYNNAPPVGALLGSSGAISSGTWVDVDVTAYVTGAGLTSMALTSSDTVRVAYGSRESANAPELIIQTGTGGPTPTPTNTPVPPTPTDTPVPPTPTNTPQPGNTFTFNPVADAYVYASRPNGNRGGSSLLRTDAAPDTLSYLRFDVQGLSGTITNATLRLYVQRNSSIGYDVQSVSDNTWGELSITYNNAPAVGSVIGSSGSVSGGTWVEVDVTSYITGAGLTSMALTSGDTSRIDISSREGAHPPELIIQTGN